MAARPDRAPRPVPELQTLLDPTRYSFAQIRLAVGVALALGRGTLILTEPPENDRAEG